MEIQEMLAENDVLLSVKYYGINDYSTRLEIKELLEYADLINAIFDRPNLTEISTVDDYHVYLLSCKMIGFEEIIPIIIQDEHKKTISCLITKAKNIVSEVDRGSVISYINSSYTSILKPDSDANGLIDIFDATIDLIVEYISGISLNVVGFLCQNYGNTIISNYGCFEKNISNNPELFDYLFPEYDLDCIRKYNYKDSLGVIAHIYLKSKDPLKSKAEMLICSLSKEIEELSKNLNTENIIFFDQTIRQYIAFLRRIKHVDANRFEKIQHDIDKLIKQHIENHGQLFSTEIPVDEIRKKLTSDINIINRILFITHKFDNETKEIISHLNKPPKGKESIMDRVARNIPVNDYFTYSHQRSLDTTVSLGSVTMHIVLSDEKLANEFLKGYFVMLQDIATNIQYDLDELTGDFDVLTQMIGNVFYLPKGTDEVVIHSLCYGAAVFICSLSEKILRLCYLEETKDIVYTPQNKATLGVLLDCSRQQVKDLLGEFQAKHLNFFFGQDKDGLVGMNYRNRLAHWHDITADELIPQLVCRLFYLFTCITNSVYLYYNSQNDQSTYSMPSEDVETQASN